MMIRASTTIALLMLVTAGLAAQEAAPAPYGPLLPPVDQGVGLAEAQRAIYEQLDARIREVEDRVAQEGGGASATERLRSLERVVQLLETRNQLERARVLGATRPKYTDGYRLVSDMQTRVETLVALNSAVAAFEAVASLTDLRQYSSFNNTYQQLLLRVRNPEERKWMSDLLERAVPRLAAGATSLAAVHPALGVAGIALSQLTSVLPVMARERFAGNQFVQTYDTLSCGLTQASRLHDELSALATVNLHAATELTAVAPEYPALLAQYRRIVGAPSSSDAAFYLATEARFEQQSRSAYDEFLKFADEVNAQNQRFEASARRYRNVVTRHLEYWERMRQVLQSQKNATCLASDTAMLQRFDQAIARIDTVIADVRRAYLFEGTERPENEYFRLATGQQ